jgi:hypothetical protein
MQPIQTENPDYSGLLRRKQGSPAAITTQKEKEKGKKENSGIGKKS